MPLALNQTNCSDMGLNNSILFISRHTPTPDQIALAHSQFTAISHVGDMDAFASENDIEKALQTLFKRELASKVSVCAVHPRIAAIAQRMGFKLAFFENETRAPEGAKPTFHAKALHFLGR
jgi:hypothetical protein